MKFAATHANQQTDLFGEEYSDLVFTSEAQKRNYIGKFYERASEELLGLHQLRGDGRCEICPDLKHPTQPHYYECKSSGRSNRVLVYKFRLQKEWEFANQPGIERYTYLIWVHNTLTSECETLKELREDLAENTKEVLAVPLVRLRFHSLNTPVKIFSHVKDRVGNKRWGHTRGGYAEGGWSLPLKALREGLPNNDVAYGSVYGNPMMTTVWSCRDSKILVP